jgi:hypothetical protein
LELGLEPRREALASVSCPRRAPSRSTRPQAPREIRGRREDLDLDPRLPELVEGRGGPGVIGDHDEIGPRAEHRLDGELAGLAELGERAFGRLVDPHEPVPGPEVHDELDDGRPEGHDPLGLAAERRPEEEPGDHGATARANSSW